MSRKIVRQLCFSDKQGERALEVYDNPKYGLTKSRVVIELLDIYREFEEKYGEEAFFKMKEMIRNSN